MLLTEKAKQFIVDTILGNIQKGDIQYARNQAEKHISSGTLNDADISVIETAIAEKNPPVEIVIEEGMIEDGGQN